MKIGLTALLSGLLFLPATADDKPVLETCKTENHCAIDKFFNVRVDRIKKRGDYILLQLKYKTTTRFGYDVKYEQASLIDSNGKEAVIEGGNITGYSISSGRTGTEKNVSLKFKAEGFKWGEKFDLEVKAGEPHGAIAFFDLSTN